MINKKKKLTIDNFTPIIPFDLIRDVFRYHYGKIEGNKEYRRFNKWMNGQTCAYNGVYIGDLSRFLLDLPVID